MLAQSTAGLAPAPSVPAFADLYGAWRRRVAAFFFRRGVPFQDVEDLVQATFVEAWRSWPAFIWTNERQFAGWLFAIALHQLFKARRRAERDGVVVALGQAAYQLANDHAGACFDQVLDHTLLAPALVLPVVPSSSSWPTPTPTTRTTEASDTACTCAPARPRGAASAPCATWPWS